MTYKAVRHQFNVLELHELLRITRLSKERKECIHLHIVQLENALKSGYHSTDYPHKKYVEIKRRLKA